MRTVPFKRVFDKAIRWLGLNPYKEIPPDERDAMVDRINDRVSDIVKGWRWPEWDVTEQRAFRQVWNDTRQYLRDTGNGLPDEVFFLDTISYYQVNPDATGDPPVGTVPTNIDFWLPMEPAEVGTYIEYDQGCRRSIGIINGIYQSDPSKSGCGCNGTKLKYHPSQFGVEVCNPGGPTVFINYQMPTPRYTMVPYAPGKVYQRADVIFDPGTGECFQALLVTTNAPNTTDWRRIPFLEKWEKYVSMGAYADALTESDLNGNQDVQQRQLLAQAIGGKADDALQSEVDALSYQGQLLKWSPCKRNGYWCESQPWSGTDVTEISEACEDDLGWVFPLPPPVPPGRIESTTNLLKGDDMGNAVDSGIPPEDVGRISLPNVFQRENTFPVVRIIPRIVTHDIALGNLSGEIIVDCSIEDTDIVIELPVSDGTGQNILINRRDTTAHTVQIITQGSDLISGGVTSFFLSASLTVTMSAGDINYWTLAPFVSPLMIPDNIAFRDVNNFFFDGTVNSFAGLRFARKIISDSYLVKPSDCIIYIQGQTADIDIQLPKALVADGRGQLLFFQVLDTTGFVVRINPDPTLPDQIDDSTSLTLVDKGAQTILNEEDVGMWRSFGTIANGSSTGTNLTVNEVPAGTVDGVNTVFTTAANFSSVLPYWQGIRQSPTVDYTVTGPNQFTMVVAPPTGSVLLVDYVPA